MTEKERIYNETDYLFNCDFMSDEFDADDSYEHYDRAQELLKNHKWSTIFSIWFDYLKNKCDTPEKTINFLNLFLYYGGTDEAIKNPYEFIGYIYYKIDLDKYWDVAGELLEGITISILENSGVVNTVQNPYYSPLEDPEIIASKQRWRNKDEQ